MKVELTKQQIEFLLARCRNLEKNYAKALTDRFVQMHASDDDNERHLNNLNFSKELSQIFNTALINFD